MWMLDKVSKAVWSLLFVISACAALTGCYLSRDFDYVQVFSGLNGPTQSDEGYDPRRRIFESAADIESSWIKRSLTPTELATVLTKVDFEKEFVYAFQGPETGALEPTAATSLTIHKLTWYKLDSGVASLDASIRVGIVFRDKCAFPPGPNIPFAIAVVERLPPDVVVFDGGYSMYYPKGECLSPIPKTK